MEIRRRPQNITMRKGEEGLQRRNQSHLQWSSGRKILVSVTTRVHRGREEGNNLSLSCSILARFALVAEGKMEMSGEPAVMPHPLHEYQCSVSLSTPHLSHPHMLRPHTLETQINVINWCQSPVSSLVYCALLPRPMHWMWVY